ncbi:Stealth CR1 domain-containing protein [Gilliamella sp. Pas-s27]|uniref:Stealth CR1 domain-containing protein n=1 Tax=Gilliamella sp. Pas-s27 TaxID=2687311 RepID=UPI0013654EAD|nr:Stealth CR1 domain-containing protein [Gilliamella sp. Pas-s27]MWP47793.1 UDP-N-acetylglucosamine-lysosomal-acetylglucosaminephosphotransferase [Gilliamella sp. Pas-s27]
MPKTIKKIRKLIKKPKSFFKDSFLFRKLNGEKSLEQKSNLNIKNSAEKLEHKLNSAEQVIIPQTQDNKINQSTNSSMVKNSEKVMQNKTKTVKLSNLIEDFITPHGQDEILFSLLDKAGINYHIIHTGWDHIIRIAIQDAFVRNIIELIKGNEKFTKGVYIVEGSNRYDLVRLYFHDDTYVYKNTIFQFDPWYMTPHGVITRNKNAQIQFIPKAHINKTVHSFAPIRLGKNIQHIDSINSMLELNSFLFDEYEGPIDIVYTWVSDSDPEWLEKKSYYSGINVQNQDTRFVDYEQLRYSLRSVASYAKFIRKIFIVTDNQIPYWLDTDHEQIVMVNHSDICNDKTCLPVFNSVAIESWIHKIEGLSDNFIYANDDYFFGSPVNKQHFIHPNGIAKLFLEPVPNAYGEVFADSEPTNQLSLFTAQCFYEKFNKWPSFWPLHAPMIKNVHVIDKMISQFQKQMDETSRSRFRESGTISPLYLMSSYFSYVEGNSVLSSIRYEYVSSDDPNLDSKLSNLLLKIKEGKCEVFCLNDHRTITDAQISKVASFMMKAFPIAAEWELDKTL